MENPSFELQPDSRTVGIADPTGSKHSGFGRLKVPSWTPAVPISCGPSSEGLLEDLQSGEGSGTTPSAQLQVMLTCLGVAALTIPHLFAQVGWVIGSIILATPALIACLSMRQIVLLGEAAGQKGMAGAFTPHLGGKVGILLSSILFLLFEFIVAACMAIPCDIVPQLSVEVTWLPDMGKETVGLIIVAASACAGFAKDLSALDSFLKPSILLVIYLMVVIVVRACVSDARHEMKAINWDSSDRALSLRMIDCFATASAAFGAECAILAIYANLAPQYKRPMESFSLKVIDLPMLLMILIYIVFGFAGYSEYGDAVEPNLLKTMGNEWWSAIAKFGLSVVNAVRVPLFNTVQWYTALDLIPVLGKLDDAIFGFGRPLVITSMNAFSLGLLLSLDNFGKVMGFLGGLLGIPINNLLPCAAWLAARYCSRSPVRGSHPVMDGFSFLVMIAVTAYYLINAASLFY